MPASTDAIETPEPLRSIFARFLKFGLLAWGGPAAQIAMIKRECVDEEMWVSEASFKKLLAVYQILPGPEAHELCVYFGRLRGGKMGGFLAGLGFMLPGFVPCRHRCRRFRPHALGWDHLRPGSARRRHRLRVVDQRAALDPSGQQLRDHSAGCPRGRRRSDHGLADGGDLLRGLEGRLLTFGGAFTVIPFLLGVAAAVIGLIAAVTVTILETSVVNVYTALIALGAFAALQRWHGKLTVVYVMGVAGIVGVVLQHTAV